MKEFNIYDQLAHLLAQLAQWLVLLYVNSCNLIQKSVEIGLHLRTVKIRGAYHKLADFFVRAFKIDVDS